jgi:hypothetical protein
MQDLTCQRFLSGAVGAAVILGMLVPSVVGAETLKGRIVDQACYLKNKTDNVGKDHKMPADLKDCAVACAKQGNPLALLTADGNVYQIAGELVDDKNKKLVRHISHTVEITGDVMGSGDRLTIHASALKMISAQ